MNFPAIRYFTGWILKLLGLFLFLPPIISLIYHEKLGIYYLIVGVATLILGQVLTIRKPSNMNFFAKEGFVIVVLSWLNISFISAIPYMLTGEIPSFVDALFESISGYTTTGASIVPDVDLLSHTTNFFRCFTHWIGGMGVLVFMLAILPLAGGQSMHIMRAESSGPSVGKIVPKLRQTAVYLYVIYLGLTFLEFITLVILKLPVFDAICTTFSTAGTGGFSVHSTSLSGYSTGVQITVTVFMILFGVNFTFYFLLLARKFKNAFSISEVWVYLSIMLCGILIIFTNLMMNGFADTETSPFKVFLSSALHTASFMSSTGFSSRDVDLWPMFSKSILIVLMICGGCAGSTGGGIKISRIMLYLKTVKRELYSLLHPRSVRSITMDGKAIDRDTLRTVHAYLMTYILFGFASLVLISLNGFDFETNVITVLATLNNTGLGFAKIGPSGGFSEFSPLSKVVMMVNMLAGRLELFPVLVFLSPATWRKSGI